MYSLLGEAPDTEQRKGFSAVSVLISDPLRAGILLGERSALAAGCSIYGCVTGYGGRANAKGQVLFIYFLSCVGSQLWCTDSLAVSVMSDSGLLCPPPEDLPNPRMEPASLLSPASAGQVLSH